MTTSPRAISRSLSGLLCGTHSGASSSRRGLLAPNAIAEAHREHDAQADPVGVVLGLGHWRPEGPAATLGKELEAALDPESVIDLLVYGSLAHGGTTGFSDVDAILVISDEAADDPGRLKALRPRVLEAQRAVLRYQPMQHHGFEIVTPRLLARAEDALELPEQAVADSLSVRAAAVEARFPSVSRLDAGGSLRRLTEATLQASSWPSHPCDAHQLISMFELLPAVYLQARGTTARKADSFEQARAEFGDAWWPYDVLRAIRSRWPRVRAPTLRTASRLTRNPWFAQAAWRRAPRRIPNAVAPLLTIECLTGLRELADRMRAEAT